MQKCPPKSKGIKCPLQKFEDETANEYARRCKAAAQLAQAAVAAKEEEEAASAAEDEEGEGFEEEGPIDDISSPEDEW